ncbi:hypothetical protein [Enterovirga sp.]|uniref:hypothetical protein n=1 Tax=Enterovirga sp. TaxID=2026350 RepID=UPI002C561985|nr:hypothetical protein [Enterovirga sp.]HMO28022.1 hypothetical protein [Enterovirga sp.]
MAEQPNELRTSSGVDGLISRLRDEGVGAGRREAERLVRDAQAHAREILREAEAAAEARTARAAAEAEALRRAGQEALNIAARDAVLDLKDRLTRRFAEEVAKTVSGAMKDEDLLKRMILAVAGRAREEGGIDRSAEAVVELPREAVGLDDLRRRPEELVEGSLVHFAAASAGAMLREGVTLARSEDEEGGIRLQLLDRGVSIDLTDKAVAQIILSHLQPRFRAMLEGIIR